MSELSAPSYRVQRPSSGGGFPWRMTVVAAAILGAMGVGALAVWGLTRAVSSGVPTVEADTRPLRVKPEDPGGLRVANQGERIFETQNQPQRRGTTPAAPAQPQVAPEFERPDLNGLRQATVAARQAAQAQAQMQPQPPQSPPAQPSPEAPAAAPQPGTAPAAPREAAPAVSAPPPAEAPRPTAAAARPPEPASRAAEGSAVVQLGALGSEEAARAEWARLKGRLGDLLADRRPQVIRFEREGQPTMWRLRTGGFRDHDAARAFCEAAKTKGAPACAAIGG
ncbi:SPOR domain-containing protein [Roseomonas elaeocarpi]|uniref:SPOR domain-containing protein n=1 Tax=Roseomonas elaeocarpi TaxID=907779 RepID=A0ABV6JXX5_9PROT